MRTQFRKATIKDVAARAGVSPTTVSHFVSGRAGACSPETAYRIRVAVDELHYSPSSSGRALRLNATNTIGVALQSKFEFDHNDDGYSYINRILRGITIAAGEADYALLYYPPKIQSGKDYHPFLDGRVDGLLFHAAHDDGRPNRLADIGIPIVNVSRTQNLHSRCGSVFANEADTVNLAMTHLWERGHRRIAHIAGPVHPRHSEVWDANSQSDIAIERLNRYIDFLKERGVYDPALIAYENAWEPQNPAKIVATLRSLPNPPTAVFCACDLLAYGFRRAATDAGWHVPAQIAVVGVDNLPSKESNSSLLTSVDIPLDVIGAEAVRLLIKLIQGEPESSSLRIAVPVTSLVIRDTT